MLLHQICNHLFGNKTGTRIIEIISKYDVYVTKSFPLTSHKQYDHDGYTAM